MKTTMFDAFTKAGFKPTPEKLRGMMEKAIEAGAGELNPSVDHFIAALALAHDIDLLWELFLPVHRRVIGDLYDRVRTEFAAARKAGGGSVDRFSKEPGTAFPPPAAGDAGQRAASSQEVSNEVPASPAPSSESEVPASDARRNAGHAVASSQEVDQELPAKRRATRPDYSALASVYRKARLRDFMVTNLSDHGGSQRPLGTIRVTSLPRLLKAYDKRAWVSATERNMIKQIVDLAERQAFIPAGHRVEDLVDEGTFEKFRDRAVSITDSPLVQLPQTMEGMSNV